MPSGIWNSIGCDLPSANATSFALEFGAIADADDVELLLEAGGDAGDRVRDERARQAVKSAVLVGIAERVEHAVFLLEA